jgi:hypothetical protein
MAKGEGQWPRPMAKARAKAKAKEKPAGQSIRFCAGAFSSVCRFCFLHFLSVI